jgi:hypothetical protein
MKNTSASMSVAAFTDAVKGEVRVVQNAGSWEFGVGSWEFGVWSWEFGVWSLERKFDCQLSTVNF